jgi:Chain length determinant protein
MGRAARALSRTIVKLPPRTSDKVSDRPLELAPDASNSATADARGAHDRAPVESAASGAGEFDLDDLRRAWRTQWRLICACALAALLLSIVYLHLATYRYSVTLQVTAASGHGGGSTSKLGNLASLAGLNLPMPEDETPFELYIHGLTSRQTADLLAQDNEFLRGVFGEEWSVRESRWVEPRGVIPVLKRGLRRILGGPRLPWSPPDGARLHKRLVKEIRIDRKKSSPIVSLSVASPNPEIGRMILWKLHLQSDGILRERTLKRTSEYIAYLQDKLRTVDVAEYRQALSEILTDQEKTRMVASSTLPFAAEPFGRPTALAAPTYPNQLLVIAGAILGAIALGTFLAVRRQARHRPA